MTDSPPPDHDQRSSAPAGVSLSTDARTKAAEAAARLVRAEFKARQGRPLSRP